MLAGGKVSCMFCGWIATFSIYIYITCDVLFNNLESMLAVSEVLAQPKLAFEPHGRVGRVVLYFTFFLKKIISLRLFSISMHQVCFSHFYPLHAFNFFNSISVLP